MAEPDFLLDGYSVARLSPDDLVDLQDLYERCSDYYLLIEDVPTRSTAAEEDLREVPPGKELSDKFFLGIYSAEPRMIGALELARDYPAEHEWWIALLLLDPQTRGAGLGTRIYEAARTWAVAQEAQVLSLLVLEQNTSAERFWRRHGFEEQRRAEWVAATGYRSRGIIMSQRVVPATSA